MLPWFKFNNVLSSDLGIIVKEMPPISKSQKNIETISISGRNGNLHIDEKTYKSKPYSIKCILTDKTKINDIKKLFDIEGILEFSEEENIIYTAILTNQINFAKYLTYLKEFTLEFDIDPIGYSKTEKIATIIPGESNQVILEGTAPYIFPTLKITGIGIIIINDISVEVLESNIEIDCCLMNCTRNGINMNNKVILEDFPSLIPGENNVILGPGITKLEIIYREGYF